MTLWRLLAALCVPCSALRLPRPPDDDGWAGSGAESMLTRMLP